METIISAVISVVATAIVTIMISKKASKKEASKYQSDLESATTLMKSQIENQYAKALTKAESERDSFKTQLKEMKDMAKAAEDKARESLSARLEEQHNQDTEQFEKLMSEKEAAFTKVLEEKDKAHKSAIERMAAHHAESNKEQQARFAETIKALSAEMKSSTEEILKKRQEDLDKTNQANMGQLLSPLQQQMDEVKKLMGDTKSANEKSSESLKGALDAMISQTQQLGKDATNLADALKNKGKVHGDWGEHVLEDILAGSGLREGIEYSKQESFKGEHGNELRPDVMVRCADGKSIVVDSKVSLKDYADALGAETEEERQAAIKKNYESVKKHVKELAGKQYPKYVEGSLNYVLMFVPNEGSYVMAMNYDHSLAQEAFRQGVIIVNPTNLMLTLHLVLQTWQSTRQEENCKQIINAANGMYDKVVTLVDTCTTLGGQLDTAMRTHNKMVSQLSDGSGNLLRRVSGLKEMGVTSTKMPKTKKQPTATLIAETAEL